MIGMLAVVGVPHTGEVRMNPAAKTLFIQALRSGAFRQTWHHLRVGEAFCAEGVLCEVFRQVTGRGMWVKRMSGDVYVFTLGGDASAGEPPFGVIQWAGWVTVGGEPEFNPQLNGLALTQWNDTGASFGEIADLVEVCL